MNHEEASASSDANTLAPDQNVEQTNVSTSRGLNPSERIDAINVALKNGSITHNEAEQIKDFYIPHEGVNLIPASSIVPEAIDWIWYGYLAAGKFHILAGAPGTGKTTIALDLAATISLGRPWPDDSKCVSGNILIWSGEDDAKDTLVPRLIAAGADRNRIHFIGDVNIGRTEPRPFNPSTDMLELQKKANEIGNIKLIIVDPIIHAVTGDSHNNGDVRHSLKPLVDLATQLNAAILGITHFTKGTAGKEPLDRVTGSLAFGAVARIVLVTSKESMSSSMRYILARAKSNIGLYGDGFYYEIQETTLSNFPGITTSKIAWKEIAEGSIQDLLSQSKDNENQSSTLQEAQEFISSILADGAMKANDVYACAKDAGFSKTTVDRAKKALGLKPYKVGYGADSKWLWPLPSKVTKPSEDIQVNSLSTFDKFGDLRKKLLRIHPNRIEGCLLTDILAHADQTDLEDLTNIEAVKCFALHLIGCGKLNPNNDR
jgi:RecA-family ATPase